MHWPYSGDRRACNRRGRRRQDRKAPQRLLLLCRLIEGEASVGDLAAHAKLAHSTASQHLGKMRAEGLVATRREAQTIYYRLADPAAVRVLDTLCDIYRGK